MKSSSLVFGLALFSIYQVLDAFITGKASVFESKRFIQNTHDKPNGLHWKGLHPLSNQALRRRLRVFSRMYPFVISSLEASALSRGGSFPPMDPDTVVTFEPAYSCPKMVSKPASSLQKIYYGTNVEEGEFPFLVAVKFSKTTCTGSIATKNHVLTAAHCTTWKSYAKLYVGHPDKDFAQGIPHESVSSLVEHPGYERNIKLYDYAVIILKVVITFVPGKVEPICIFLGDVRYWKMKQNDPAYKTMVTGWGLTELGGTRIAKKLWVPAMTCKRRRQTGSCHPDHICFREGRGGICRGDSGGPVLGHEKSLGAWVQIGINSFIYSKTEKLECGSEGTISFSSTFFYFEKPGLNSRTGNPWCDFFTKEIPHDVHLVKGSVHPNVFCENPKKRFDWCEFPAP